MRDGLGVPADQQQLRLQDHARGGELHAPIVDRRAPVALAYRQSTRAGPRRTGSRRAPPSQTAASAPTRLPSPIWSNHRSCAFCRNVTNGSRRSGRMAVGRAVGVLDPPRVPGGPFDQAVPLRLVKHGEVLQLRVRLKHPPRRLQQPQILHVPAPAIMFALEAGAVRAGRAYRAGRGGQQQPQDTANCSETPSTSRGSSNWVQVPSHLRGCFGTGFGSSRRWG